MSAQAFNDVLSDDDLATTKEVIDRALDRLKQLSDAYGELLVHRLDSGKVFQNWAKESSLGNRRWKAGITADNIRLVSGISIEKPGMMTPAQAEKAGVSKLITKAFTERPNTGFKLVKRSAADRAAAMFSPPETE
jgi:hypothetical protein